MPKNKTQKFDNSDYASEWKYTKKRPGDMQESSPRPLASLAGSGSAANSPRGLANANSIIKSIASNSEQISTNRKISKTQELNNLLKQKGRPSDLNMVGSILVGQGTSLEKTGG